MEEKNDMISVIVPIYKVEEFLDECIQSIVDQTYQNLQIILVDDGSPDHCGEMCEDWAKKDKRIEVIHKKMVDFQMHEMLVLLWQQEILLRL